MATKVLHARRESLSLEGLRAELANHLGNTNLAFVVEDGRQFLAIPDHAPIETSPTRSRATGSMFYEETTTVVLDYLIKRLQPACFYDIGAAQGYFSRVAASHRSGGPLVHAFEMRESEVAGMRRIIENDPFATRIFPHWAAVSDRDAPGEQIWYARSLLFEEPPIRDQYVEAWWRRLKFWLRHDKTRGLSSASATVTSIDGFARRTRTSPDIIKIDVEGYEGRVLQGARETLRLSRPYVLLELHSDKKLRFGFSRQDVAKVMFDANYDCLFFTDHQNKNRCAIVEVTSGDPLLSRQKTDLVLFVPR